MTLRQENFSSSNTHFTVYATKKQKGNKTTPEEYTAFGHNRYAAFNQNILHLAPAHQHLGNLSSKPVFMTVCCVFSIK
jgi:hypothetical protein